MAIIGNRSSEIGDVITIEVEVPIVGLLALQTFVDTTIGESATRFWDKEFRHKADGINWSPWQPLTLTNVQAVQVSPTSVFKVEYRYTRAGTDAAGDLEWDDATLGASYDPHPCGPTYNDSVFAQFFSCTDQGVINWCLNVLEKLYQSGIVPEYITRNANSNQDFRDKDYLDFWNSVSCYFALFVRYARVFESFNSDPVLLLEFLKQRGMLICDGTDEADLLYLMNNFYNEMRRRGTPMMNLKKGDTLVDGQVVEVDGEILRLLCTCCCDEFLFSLTETYNNSAFNIGNHSPLYRGLNNHQNTNKGYDNKCGPYSSLPTPADLTAYPVMPTGTIVNVLTPDNNGVDINAWKITANNTVGGWGMLDDEMSSLTQDIKDKAITYDPCTSYEISFRVKFTNPEWQFINFSFQAFAKDFAPSLGTGKGYRFVHLDGSFDNADDQRNKFISSYNSGSTNIYGAPASAWFPQADKWYYVSATVDAIFDDWITDPQYAPGLKLEGLGITTVNQVINNNTNWNLKPGIDALQAENIDGNLQIRTSCWAVPSLWFATGVEDQLGDVYVTDFVMRPRATPYSTGFCNLNNWINMWAHNGNAEYTYDEIEDKLREYLIPYNSSFRLNKTQECTNFSSAQEYKALYSKYYAGLNAKKKKKSYYE